MKAEVILPDDVGADPSTDPGPRARPTHPIRPRPVTPAVLPPGAWRALVLSDSSVMRAGLRLLLPVCGVRVAGELEARGRLHDSIRATAAQLVIAAPGDGRGDDALFAALAALPEACGSIVLLAVPGFRIQATTVSRRFDVACLPVNVECDELRRGIRRALVRDRQRMLVQDRCAGVRGALSTREQEVLRELAQGKGNRAIAETLWVSEDTVKSHLQRIYRKLGVKTRAAAVALYIGQVGTP